MATGVAAITEVNKTAILLNTLSAAERKSKYNFTFFISFLCKRLKRKILIFIEMQKCIIFYLISK